VFRHRFQLRAADVPLYRLCDQATGNVILLMVVFSPWAFGSAQAWAIWTMNVAGYVLGALLLVKLFIRKLKNYPAPRWDSLQLPEQRRKVSRPPVRAATRTLAWLTVALLLYCVLHAVNAAATFDPEKNLFLYRRHLDWLPHSFDAHRTWFHFWMYLGLAATFWSLRDWLLGRTAAEEKIFRQQTTPVVPRIPERLRRLLWLLAINGTLLGLEAIVQHASGSNKLLFLVEPAVNSSPTGDAHFGPFGYRSNAAQYFDMLWPLVLGGWWRLRNHSLSGKIHLLPVGAAVMAACPIISLSRAGAIVAAGLLVTLTIIFLAMELSSLLRSEKGRQRAGQQLLLTLVFLGVVTALGGYFGWEKLSARLDQIDEGYAFREQMYVDAWPMVKDYPVFGTGPGTFATVFQLYRISNATFWAVQLHNDWLETLITFGGTGLLLALAALGCVVVNGWFAPRRLFITAGLALVGCLVQARFDFPLQNHCTLFLFLLICAVLSALGAMVRRN